MPVSPPNTRGRAIVYSGFRPTALSQPAFEQCLFPGCAPTGPLRPSLGAHMKRPSHLHLRSGIQPGTRSRPAEDRVAGSKRTTCFVVTLPAAVTVEVPMTDVVAPVLIPYARFVEVRARRLDIVTELTQPDGQRADDGSASSAATGGDRQGDGRDERCSGRRGRSEGNLLTRDTWKPLLS